jgi:hypothetical protein
MKISFVQFMLRSDHAYRESVVKAVAKRLTTVEELIETTTCSHFIVKL